MVKLDKDKIIVLKNTASLIVLQATNYLLPLITLPYLSRILGPEKFGLIFFAQMFINYFMILSDYGFNQIGVRQVTQNQNNNRKLSLIVSSIFNLRIFLSLIGFGILLSVITIFDTFTEDKLLYVLTFGMVIGNMMMPTWFFQGIQQMKYITVLNLVSKLIFTVSLFIFVNSKKDYLLVPLLNSLGFIISGIIAIYLLRKKYEIDIYFTPLEIIKKQLRIGFSMFATNLSIASYTSTNAFILGNVVSNQSMGYYGGVEKIIHTMKFMFTPFYNALYPYFSNNYVKNKQKFYKEIKIGFFASLLGGAVIYCSMIFFAEEIITFILGKEYLQGLDVFYIFSILILITPSSYFLFNVVFLSLSLEQYSMRIYVIGGVFNIILLSILLYLFDHPSISAAVANVVTQILNLVIATWYILKHIQSKS